MATLVSSKTEYQFSEEKIKALIAKELNVDIGEFDIRFDRTETFVPGDYLDVNGKFVYTIKATIDHAKNKAVPKTSSAYRTRQDLEDGIR